MGCSALMDSASSEEARRAGLDDRDVRRLTNHYLP